MATSTLEALIQLPPGERADLALALWQSLSDADRGAEFVLSDDQKAELDRRLAEHLANPDSAVAWEVIEQRHKGLR